MTETARRAHALHFREADGELFADPPFHDLIALAVDTYRRLGSKARLVFRVGPCDSVTYEAYEEIGYAPRHGKVVYRRIRVGT